MVVRFLDPRAMTVLITGGTAGFGRAAAHRFAKAGAKASRQVGGRCLNGWISFIDGLIDRSMQAHACGVAELAGC